MKVFKTWCMEILQKLLTFLHPNDFEDTLEDFAKAVEQEQIVRAEIENAAHQYITNKQSVERSIQQEKNADQLTLLKDVQNTLTTKYLNFLAQKKKQLDLIVLNKQKMIEKYPTLEKALKQLQRNTAVEKALSAYRSKEMSLVDCQTIIKALTKDIPHYSDNVVITPDGRVLLVQRAPLDTNGANLWTLPGGHVEPGESHEDAARRELREESGLEVKDLYTLGTYDNGQVHIEYFVTMINPESQTPIVNADETRYAEFVPLKDLHKYPTMYDTMWDNVYSLLGYSSSIIGMKKSLAVGFVKGAVEEKVDRLIEGKFSKAEDKTAAQKKFHYVMHEFKQGRLKDSHGKTVTNRKQAIAIALSESGLSDKAVENEFEKASKEKKDDFKNKSSQGEGKAAGKTLADIAAHHGVDIKDLLEQYELGVAVELEHTKSSQIASRIAKDHLWEIPDYYTRLRQMESESKQEIQKAKQLSHLVPRKVQIKGKDGKIYTAIRWVNPETGESEQYAEKLKPEVTVKEGTFEERVEKIVNDNSISRADKVRNLANLGIYDVKLLVVLTGEPSPGYYLKQSGIDVNELKKTVPDQSDIILKEVRTQQQNNDTPDEREKNTLLLRNPEDIEMLWQAYESNLKRVVEGRHKFALVYGTGGVGKTYTFDQMIEKYHLREYDEEIQPARDQYDFVRIGGGRITPTQVYAEMYRHRDKLIVFDDCDSVLATEEVQGFLKGGLDTGTRTQVTNKSAKKIYNVEGDPESGQIPNTFSFKGRVIAITNLTASQVDQAVKSRALCVNLTMTVDETVERLRNIKDKITIWNADKTEKIDVSQEARDLAFQTMVEYKDKLKNDINTRTYSNAVLLADDGLREGNSPEKIRREINMYFDSVTGEFDRMIRQIKGK